MANASITSFITGFQGGARTNRFGVMITGIAGFSSDTILLCKAASVPQLTLNTASVKYMGRELKYPGDRTINDWSATFYLDSDYSLKKNFEAWQEKLLSLGANVQSGIYSGAGAGEGLFSPAISVFQYDRLEGGNEPGKIIAEYKLKWAWPTEIGEVQFSADNDNTIGEFVVNFAINDIELPAR